MVLLMTTSHDLQNTGKAVEDTRSTNRRLNGAKDGLRRLVKNLGTRAKYAVPSLRSIRKPSAMKGSCRKSARE
jgi:hypothetical protein